MSAKTDPWGQKNFLQSSGATQMSASRKVPRDLHFSELEQI